MNANQIKALKPGDPDLYDDEVTGLHVRALPQRKSFYLYYRTKTRVPRRPKLGDVGILTLAQAREIGRKMLVEVAAGKDPVEERQRAAVEPTVSEVFERAYADHWSKKKSGSEVRRLFVRYCQPRLGNLRIRVVQHADVSGLHALLAADTPYQANRVLALLSKLFHLAERYGLRELHTNPVRHVERCPELSRKRFAKRHEFAALGPILAREADSPVNRPSVVFIMLVLLAGARPGEIAAARWDWLEDATDDGRRYGILRLPDAKAGARDVYLPAQAMALLDRLPRTTGTITGVQNPSKLWQKIRREAGCPDLRLYDLRRTFATVGMAKTKNRGLVGELLGHRTAQTTLVYARLWDEAAVDAAALTGDAISGLLLPSPSPTTASLPAPACPAEA